MSVLDFAAANPVSAFFLALLVVCAVVGVADRLTEARRSMARAEADNARARLLYEQREARSAPLPPRPKTPPPAPPAPRTKWGKGT